MTLATATPSVGGDPTMVRGTSVEVGPSPPQG